MRKLEHHLTVGDLLKFIEKHNIPMDAPVVMQRVEDHYYQPGKGWDENSWKMKGHHYNSQVRRNNDMMAEMWKRSAGHEPTISAEDPSEYIMSEEDMESLREQYTQAWCPVFYKDEPNVLFLDAHY